MPTPVTLLLRTDAKHVRADGEVIWTTAQPDTVDLDALTPRARALSEAVTQLPGGRKGAGEILCLHTSKTRGDLTPNAEVWLSTEQAAEPARQHWSAWDRYPADSEMPAAEYLERQARKIPPEWSIVAGRSIATPDAAPVPSVRAGAADDRLTVRGVVDRLARKHGRHIGPGTWRSYVARGQAPARVGSVGRESLWDPAEVDEWANKAKA
ncbi:hypothetical protein [Kitasatospora sp. NPDC005748]|uniref:hypothetical protein n=1 Tax=Kitasatospora sp. NPDC005748 TaxID=3157063 RepID=UPI003403A831